MNLLQLMYLTKQAELEQDMMEKEAKNLGNTFKTAPKGAARSSASGAYKAPSMDAARAARPPQVFPGRPGPAPLPPRASKFPSTRTQLKNRMQQFTKPYDDMTPEQKSFTQNVGRFSGSAGAAGGTGAGIGVGLGTGYMLGRERP
jgi:hypothetical protein